MGWINDIIWWFYLSVSCSQNIKNIMTTIFFFGGYLATHDEVAAWRGSAFQQNYKLNVFAYPWPTGANASEPLNFWPASNSLLLAQTISQVVDPDIYIVGHSSGCAYANDIADKLRVYYPHAGFNLICLDGFVPNAALLALPSTQVWSAEWNGHKSLNYNSLCKTKNFKVYTPDHEITEVWGLHFSLVNKVTNDHTTIQTGYVNCNSNLTFIK